MIEMLRRMTLKEIKIAYGPERPGDGRHSKDSISKIQSCLNYSPDIKFKDGLRFVYNWYVNKLIKN
jgi:nucleoside-diphosphate-sugar epimerase